MITPLKIWGRWGQDDQKWTLNLVTPDKIKIATQFIKQEKFIVCQCLWKRKDRNFLVAIRPGKRPAFSMLGMASDFLMML
jgi:hypothetical protein